MSLNILFKGVKKITRKEAQHQPTIEEKAKLAQVTFPDCENEKKVLNIVRAKIKKLKESKDLIEQIKEVKLKELIENEHKLKVMLSDKLGLSHEGEDFLSDFDPFCSFLEMQKKCKLSEDFLKIIEDHYKFKIPSPIQATVIPHLSKKKNIIACSETGSGKTLSYLIPIVHNLMQEIKTGENGKCIIVLPTKELCLQIYHEIQLFSKYYTNSKVTAKVVNKATLLSIQHDFEQFVNNTDIFIANPIKVEELIQMNDFMIVKSLKYLVLDESDQFFDYGFIETVDRILFYTKESYISKSFFSATLPDEIVSLISSYIIDPIKITIGSNLSPNRLIHQQIKYCTNESGKILEVENFFRGSFDSPVLIFVEGVQNCERIFNVIKFNFPKIAYLHSQMNRVHREDIIKKFRLGEIWALVCTDLISRGIDFKNVRTVINFDCPYNEVNYIHRIGRTGRAGKSGKAITLVTDQDVPRLRKLAKTFRLSSTCECPNWILQLKDKRENKGNEEYKEEIEKDKAEKRVEHLTEKAESKQSKSKEKTKKK